MSLADYHKEFEIFAKAAQEAGTDFVTMDIMEHKRKIVHPITTASHLTDHQKGVIYNKIRERYTAIVFVTNSNQNKYGRYKEDCNNNYNNQNDH